MARKRKALAKSPEQARSFLQVIQQAYSGQAQIPADVRRLINELQLLLGRSP